MLFVINHIYVLIVFNWTKSTVLHLSREPVLSVAID